MIERRAKEFLIGWFRTAIKEDESRLSKLKQDIETGRLDSDLDQRYREEMEYLEKRVASLKEALEIAAGM